MTSPVGRGNRGQQQRAPTSGVRHGATTAVMTLGWLAAEGTDGRREQLQHTPVESTIVVMNGTLVMAGSSLAALAVAGARVKRLLAALAVQQLLHACSMHHAAAAAASLIAAAHLSRSAKRVSSAPSPLAHSDTSCAARGGSSRRAASRALSNKQAAVRVTQRGSHRCCRSHRPPGTPPGCLACSRLLRLPPAADSLHCCCAAHRQRDRNCGAHLQRDARPEPRER